MTAPKVDEALIERLMELDSARTREEWFASARKLFEGFVLLTKSGKALGAMNYKSDAAFVAAAPQMMQAIRALLAERQARAAECDRIADLESAVTELREALDDAESHLDYCGWGSFAGQVDPGRAPLVLKFLREHGVKPLALKLNRDGSPIHPLYVGYDVMPQVMP